MLAHARRQSSSIDPDGQLAEAARLHRQPTTSARYSTKLRSAPYQQTFVQGFNAPRGWRRRSAGRAAPVRNFIHQVGVRQQAHQRAVLRGVVPSRTPAGPDWTKEVRSPRDVVGHTGRARPARRRGDGGRHGQGHGASRRTRRAGPAARRVLRTAPKSWRP